MNELVKGLNKLNIGYTSDQIKMTDIFYSMLIEKNKVMNLTRITEIDDFYVKHVLDSLSIYEYTELKNKRILDVGTGAGFPGIPIKIALPETKIILLDSLNKRVKFLDEVINKLELKEIKTIHGRAEDLGRDKNYREKYDVAIARAVAPLNILLEYIIPFVKVDGKCFAMKGSNAEDEIRNSQNAINTLNGVIINNYEFFIPKTDIKRSIIEIEKTKILSNIYPRKAGIPNKKPL